MAKLIFIIFSMLLSSFVSDAQSSESERKKNNLRLNAFLGVGRSTFEADLAAPSKFPTLEVRGGAGVIKHVTDVLDIRAGLTIGAKFKRQALNQPGKPYRVGPPFLQFDEVASSRNHYFYEIPILLQANMRHPQISIRAGGNFRHFFPKNDDVDFLTARNEFGLIGGAAYRLNERTNVGVDYYYGLTKVFSSSGSVDGSTYKLHVRNGFVQLTVEYTFWRTRSGGG